MKRNIGLIIVIAVIVGAFAVLVGISLANKSASKADYSQYDLNNVIEGNDYNGGIADAVKGDKDAPVKLVEYADYQCPGCATYFPRLTKLIEEYEGKVALIYRNFLLSYHQNATAAASAAIAAGQQGYWEDYATYLFANQANWENLSASERGDTFVSLFDTITNHQGDVEKFKADMGSSNTSKKIDFDMGMGQFIDVTGTPSIYLDGEKIDLSSISSEDEFLKIMREKLDAKLESLKK